MAYQYLPSWSPFGVFNEGTGSYINPQWWQGPGYYSVIDRPDSAAGTGYVTDYAYAGLADPATATGNIGGAPYWNDYQSAWAGAPLTLQANHQTGQAYWMPGINTADMVNYTGGPFRYGSGIAGGNLDEILTGLLGSSGVSLQQFKDLVGPNADLAALAEYGVAPQFHIPAGTGYVQRSAPGGATVGAANEAAALMAMLQGAGIDWRSNPQLSALFNQNLEAANTRADSIQQSQQSYGGNFLGNVLLPGLGVLGAGYLGGTGLGALQGTGSFMDLLLNPSLTGLNNPLLSGGGAIPWNQAFAGTDLGGNFLQLGGGAGGGAVDYSMIPLELGAEFGANPSTLGLNSLIDYSGIPFQLGAEFGTNPSTLALSNQPWLQALGSLPYETQIGAIDALEGLSGADWFNKARSLLGSGLGGSGLSGSNAPWGVNQATGSILGGLLGGDNLNSALGLAPILGGLAYAYNQSDFDTGRLEDLYGQYNPNSMAYLYDQNTLAGRDQLTSNLARRGLTGSSFANMDLTNYNTQRDLGRASLISGAVPAATGIASNILNADIAERKLKNDLIGAGLYSIGTMFGGNRSSTPVYSGGTGSANGALGSVFGGLGGLLGGIFS